MFIDILNCDIEVFFFLPCVLAILKTIASRQDSSALLVVYEPSSGAFWRKCEILCSF